MWPVLLGGAGRGVNAGHPVLAAELTPRLPRVQDRVRPGGGLAHTPVLRDGPELAGRVPSGACYATGWTRRAAARDTKGKWVGRSRGT